MTKKIKDINMKKTTKAKDNVLKKANTLEGWPEIRGYDFEEEFNFENFLKSYANTGFQATNLAQSIEIIKNMRKDKATIFFAFTSNMGTCGVREQIKYITKNNMVQVMVTSAGAIEEDIIKCLKPFVLGDFRAPGHVLREDGINRTGNIFIPNDIYLYFEKFMTKFLERIYEKQKQKNEIIGIKEFVYELGYEMELQDLEKKEDSFSYWSYKNKIPFFCPALLDGSLGDMVYFFKKNHPDFKIDTSDYIVEVTDLALNSEKMGIIAIGGSVPKHVVSNAALFRDGADYVVYINSGLEMEGSNAGAPIDEAVSWGKIKPEAQKIKVESEATLVFPLIVAGAFKLYNP
ncbi:MAG: deoxyhypusine synthase [Candidatus Woesearchaeota archaeon]|jgi:deoxyhypusine synthase|nr:deoxyhypusine synthase [Candidatus Woesearchaeota archaeon]